MFSNIKLKVKSFWKNITGKNPTINGQPVPANLREAVLSEDSSEEVFEDFFVSKSISVTTIKSQNKAEVQEPNRAELDRDCIHRRFDFQPPVIRASMTNILSAHRATDETPVLIPRRRAVQEPNRAASEMNRDRIHRGFDLQPPVIRASMTTTEETPKQKFIKHQNTATWPTDDITQFREFQEEFIEEEVNRLYPYYDEDWIDIRVIGTKIHSVNNKNLNKSKMNQNNNNAKNKSKKKTKKKLQNEDPDDEETDEEEYRSDLSALGCYNAETKKVRLQLISSKKLHPIEQRLSYRDKKLPKSFIRDVIDSSFKSSKSRLLEVCISEVDRHVFYKTFTIIYKYKLIGGKNVMSSQENCFESKLQFDIPFFTEATPITFTPLGHFRPEERIVELFECDFKPINKSMTSLLKQIDSYCREPLATRPFKSNLKMLEIAQHIEDCECQKDLLKMRMKDVLFSLSRDGGGRDKEYSFKMSREHAMILKKMDLKEVSVIIGYTLNNRRGSKDIVINGKIVKIDGCNVYVSTTFDFRSFSIEIPSVSFEFNRISTRASLNAIYSVGSDLFHFLSDFDMPPIGYHPEEVERSNFGRKSFAWFNPQMAENEEQQTAIRNIVNCTAFPFPYVIFGPPGTGKTSTLVECVAQISKLKPEANILITAQSNSACDEIGSRLLETIALSKILRIYPSTLEPDKKDYLNKDLLASSNKRNKANDWPTKEEFAYFNIVIITLMSSSRLVQSDINKKHFDYIFLDECGAASEPESLVPLIGLGTMTTEINEDEENYYEDPEQEMTANIVILGDHKQLGAVINSSFAGTMGLGISLMERMMTKERYKPNPEYNTKYVTQLLANYRCHPAILQFSNAQFYNNLLRSKVNEHLKAFAENWSLLPRPGFPILFHCSKEASQVAANSTSSHNEHEVEQVLFYVSSLLKHGINGKKVLKEDIGIVCPYLAQLRKLRNALDGGIEIGTAEYYQGREKKIIIISTVKSCTGIGFLKNEKRLNVVLTRAQSLMIVVGNPETLQKDPLWRSFVHYCHDNRAIIGDKYNLTSLSTEDAEIVTKMSAALFKHQEVEEAVATVSEERKREMKDSMNRLESLMKQL